MSNYSLFQNGLMFGNPNSNSNSNSNNFNFNNNINNNNNNNININNKSNNNINNNFNNFPQFNDNFILEALVKSNMSSISSLNQSNNFSMRSVHQNQICPENFIDAIMKSNNSFNNSFINGSIDINSMNFFLISRELQF